MSKAINSTPVADGFIFPGEYEKHEATWIVWPERTDNWRKLPDGTIPAQAAFTELATAIAKNETVYMAVSKAQKANAEKMLKGSNVNIVEMENDDAWVRDSGPTCVVNRTTGEVRGVDWTFNAWGGKVDGLYDPWDKDDLVASQICEHHKLSRYRTEGFVLEGGSIHTDGEGTLFVTEACLLSEGRNPTKSKSEIEQVLKDHLGVTKIIWLKNGIYLDETNEHIDNILQVVAPGKVMLSWTDDKNDPQYAFSSAALKVLESETDAKGRKIEVIKLPAPNPLIYITKEEAAGVDAVDGTLPRNEGDRQAASYINSYIGNGAVYIPKFHGESDAPALEIYKKAFPDRKIVQIELAREIILGGGNIHCVTQQIPAKK